MTSRERVNRTLARQKADRIPRADSFWPETIPGWHTQGLDATVDVGELFDFDIVCAGWPNTSARIGYLETVGEDEETITRKDGHGAILRYWKQKSGTPEHIGFTVNDRASWELYKAEMMAVPLIDRVNPASVLEVQARARSQGKWFGWHGLEVFEAAKESVGHERLCTAMADDPDWAKDVYDTYAELTVRLLDFLEAGGAVYDGAWVYGDIAYNHGPFVSPKMYRQMVFPAKKRIIGWFKDRGLPVIFHTDGDFRPLIPGFLETGMDCFQPLEAKANIDVRELKPLWGDKVAFMGNIDATVLITNDFERIEAEVTSKVLTAREGGGYIYHSDHSIPPEVNWETYRFLMGLIDRHGRFG